MLNEQKNQIRKYISSNRLENAFDLLKNLSDDSNINFRDELIMIEAQYRSLQRKKRLGIISYSEENISQNRLTHSLLYLLENIKEEKIQEDVYDFNELSEIRILFISSGFNNNNFLRFDKEFKSIKDSFYTSVDRDKFRFIKIVASRLSDLTQSFLEYNPQFVHFSGHGSRQGIILMDFDNDERVISSNSLGKLFELFSKSIQCVFLSSCYSESQAEIISKHIPFVIGVKDSISDNEAINFSSNFYKAIGLGKSIETAFEVSNINLEMMNLSNKISPILKRKR